MRVPVKVLDVRVDICLPPDADPVLRDHIESAWQHCLVDATEPADEEIHWQGPDPVTGMHRLSQEITNTAIDARAGEAIMLHAAAIANPESGAALAVVGASGAGKTTWVQTHGSNRRYLSDETVLITPDLNIHGVPKPLSLGASGTLKQQLAPAQFGVLQADGTEQLAGLWLLDRDGTQPAQVTAVELLDALPLLAHQASYMASMDRPLHQLAAVVIACGGLRRAQYREAADLGDLVAEALT